MRTGSFDDFGHRDERTGHEAVGARRERRRTPRDGTERHLAVRPRATAQRERREAARREHDVGVRNDDRTLARAVRHDRGHVAAGQEHELRLEIHAALEREPERRLRNLAAERRLQIVASGEQPRDARHAVLVGFGTPRGPEARPGDGHRRARGGFSVAVLDAHANRAETPESERELARHTRAFDGLVAGRRRLHRPGCRRQTSERDRAARTGERAERQRIARRDEHGRARDGRALLVGDAHGERRLDVERHAGFSRARRRATSRSDARANPFALARTHSVPRGSSVRRAAPERSVVAEPAKYSTPSRSQ